MAAVLNFAERKALKAKQVEEQEQRDHIDFLMAHSTYAEKLQMLSAIEKKDAEQWRAVTEPVIRRAAMMEFNK